MINSQNDSEMIYTFSVPYHLWHLCHRYTDKIKFYTDLNADKYTCVSTNEFWIPLLIHCWQLTRICIKVFEEHDHIIGFSLQVDLSVNKRAKVLFIQFKLNWTLLKIFDPLWKGSIKCWWVGTDLIDFYYQQQATKALFSLTKRTGIPCCPN